MKIGWLVIATALIGTIAADAALAAPKTKIRVKQAQCVERPVQFSLERFFLSGPGPAPNGCSPAVYQYGRFVGQDPDPYIRQQLLRDPATGYPTDLQ